MSTVQLEQPTEITQLTIEDIYQKKEHKEHILDEPDTYVGSRELHTDKLWVLEPLDGQGHDYFVPVNEEQINTKIKSQKLEGGDSESGDSEGNSLKSNEGSNQDITSVDNTNLTDQSNQAMTQTSPREQEKQIVQSSTANKISRRMVKRKISYVPALYKIFDEILVNAIDQWVRLNQKAATQTAIQAGQAVETSEVNLKMNIRPVKNIKIWVDADKNEISIQNDGDGVDVEKHKDYDMYVPQLIFSELLTSANYRNEDMNLNMRKVTGGKNGYGAKLTSLFSNRFTIETVDANRKRKYVQTYRDNLEVIEEPKITTFRGIPYTRITFQPDLARFGLKRLPAGLVALMEKRAYDTAGYCDGRVNIFYNDQKLDIKSFERYTDLYLGERGDTKRVYVNVSDRWQVCVCASDDHELEQVSFVNGIWTSQGGKHIDYLANQIARKLSSTLSKGKNKVEPRMVKSNLWLFVRSVIVNPGFNSQVKECLTTNVESFGSKCLLSDDAIAKIGKCGVAQRAKQLADFKNMVSQSKSDGKKTSKVYLKKLWEGDYPGTKKSRTCTLILTEGSSAKGFAVEGLKVLSEEERQYFGIFPLRGKLLNVKTARPQDIEKNEEICALKKILGLQNGMDYTGTNINKLRYGKVRALCDQDPDGDHIKGLIMNLFKVMWPSLVARNDFLDTMITPLVIVWKNKKQNRDTVRQQIQKFYSLKEYQTWKNNHQGEKGWEINYYKGLGSSNDQEGQEAFREMRLIQYRDLDHTETNRAFDLAFDKELADQRKQWLANMDPDYDPGYDITEESLPDFIDKRLRPYSWEDTKRSIPNLCDGLKTSQRKILYTILKNNIKNKLKVDQLVGKITHDAAYHQGENSLQEAIVKMAQNFVGANNINLLVPEGNFGSRYAKGSDAAATRYIKTYMERMVPVIYRKEDFPLYEYTNDDGFPTEPTWYLPIIPMILVNGACGIGTGYSTNIPQYNPTEIIARLRLMLAGKPAPTDDLVPWYRGFRGRVSGYQNGYLIQGVYSLGDNTLRVTELPPDHSWQDYKEFLELLERDKPDEGQKKKAHHLQKLVKRIRVDASACTAEVKFSTGGLNTIMGKGGLENVEKEFKLRSKISVANMTLFNEQGKIKKYPTAQSIIEAYFGVRLSFYGQRKKWLLNNYDLQCQKLQAKYRFLKEVMDEEIIIYRKKTAEILTALKERGYPEFKADSNQKGKQKMDLEKENQQESSEGDLAETEDLLNQLSGPVEKHGYGYLLNLQFRSVSEEKLEEIKKQILDIETKIENLKILSHEELWLTDLDELEKEWTFWIKKWYQQKKIKIPSKIRLGLSQRLPGDSSSTEVTEESSN